MHKICTSLEQSKKLIELGIDINTADMFWKNGVSNEYIQCFTPFVSNGTNIDFDYDIPAWSLSALLELMPPYLFEFERGIDLNIYPNLSSKAWHCSYMPNVVENMKNDKNEPIEVANHAEMTVKFNSENEISVGAMVRKRRE